MTLNLGRFQRRQNMGLYAHENIAVQLFAALQAEWDWGWKSSIYAIW